MAEFIQPGPSLGNPFAADPLLQAYLRWRLPPDLQEALAPGLLAFGRRVEEEVRELGREAEDHPPRHIPFGPFGDRLDRIEVSGAWQRLQDIAAEEGLVSAAYARKEGSFSRLHQFARLYLFHPDSAGSTGPLAMADGAARTLEIHGDAFLREEILPRLLSRKPAESWTAGQWMTERSGGSDLSGTATLAKRTYGHGRPAFDHALYGSKAFTTATLPPMALTLARVEGAPAGGDSLSLFYVETRDEKGALRGIRVDRLLNTLGLRALPLADIALEGTPALLVGERGHGVRKIAPFFTLTRIHGTLQAAASMRRALALAKDYAGRRAVFGRNLIDQPLQAETLGAMQVEWEGCFHLAFHLSLLLGRQESGEARDGEAALLRLLTPVAKLYTGRSAVAMAVEAAEAFGGAGYVEDTGVPALLRNALALPVKDGTTHVLALDVLRALDRDGAFEPLLEDAQARLRKVREDGLSDALRRVKRAFDSLKEAKSRIAGGDAAYAEAEARAFSLGLARAYAGTLMLEYASWSAENGAGPAADRAAFAALRWCREPMASLPVPDAAHRAATRSLLAD